MNGRQRRAKARRRVAARRLRFLKMSISSRQRFGFPSMKLKKLIAFQNHCRNFRMSPEKQAAHDEALLVEDPNAIEIFIDESSDKKNRGGRK